MSAFIHLRDAKVTINFDQIAYVEDVTAWGVDDNERDEVRLSIQIAFAAGVAPNPYVDDWESPVPLALTLRNDDAETFMNALMRRAEVW